jgi:23S rRNA (guanosine2251-2'-O)-methyltransferase
MGAVSYRILECTQPECRLRFPATNLDGAVDECPCCGASLRAVYAGVLQQSAAGRPSPELQHPLLALLDNVRSVFNAGSIFRSADGAGLLRLWLCGITPTPEHPKFAKTALGAEQSVSWQHARNGVDVARQLLEEGHQLWALEGGSRAEPLFEGRLPIRGLEVAMPVVLVVGNEVTGIDPELLTLCDRVLSIPMQGMKRSLNVATAFGIAVYWLRGTELPPSE